MGITLYLAATMSEQWTREGYTKEQIQIKLKKLSDESSYRSNRYDDDDIDYDNGYSHSEQSYADRSDYARELYESGRIDRIQMAEMRMGA